MGKILIDTDVILDFFFDRQPFSEEASQILSLCESKKLNGFVTPIMISNIYYILRKTAKHEKVIEGLKSLMDIVDVAVITKNTIVDALNSNFKDFEDALQNFSALDKKDINIIITRNIKDYKTSSLSVMTPETYLKTIK
ncbi:DNA-binding protein [Elizabethkingia miricola]|uniref:DNA-binding protein n=3 Tax=Weeksellaceae TaxID=2762318 RepID=A0ABD4DRJ8_ELIMR|nr:MULTISPECIES: PIN domain-containing protein [Elizabethkingia]MDX8566613.1 PIN domain-containing protein [Elizabethkingia sp. HX XZB]KUY21399.1 DNA-binding protein [Elizabethkingia miricola]MCL1651427.1 PIN domain-containing protein [Elizabethkingia miricola]MCL1663064.1 PIN domain-containing protein [Elizabethkingia ursingii]MCL1678538.1 PIN domain-containing protein [Elizabethkingia miricola]